MMGTAGNDRFLILLDSDPREAERKYGVLRSKLVLYFQHNACPDPEDLADEVFSRALRRSAEEIDLHSGLNAYCYGIANNILYENRRSRRPTELPAEIAEPRPTSILGLNHVEQHVFVQQFLQDLPEDERKILLRYFAEDRAALAKELQMTENVLRIRVCRIKHKLEKNIARQSVAARAKGLK